MRDVPCACCGESRAPRAAQDVPTQDRIAYRGLGNCCVAKVIHAGNLADYPRQTRSRDDLLDEWEMLRPQGFTYGQAAERLGMTRDALERGIQRGRAAGDERARPPVREFGAVYGPVDQPRPARLPERAEQRTQERTELVASWDPHSREERDMERREQLAQWHSADIADARDQDVEAM